MQNADEFVFEVFLSAERIVQFAEVIVVHADRHGVDGEVAAAEIVVEGGFGHCGERARMGVGFSAGGCKVKRLETRDWRIKNPSGGEEFFVDGELAAVFFDEGAGEFDGVAFEGEIKVDDGATQHEVPNRTADEVEGKSQRGGFVGDAVNQVHEGGIQRFFEEVGEIHMGIVAEKIVVYNRRMLLNPLPRPLICTTACSG